MAEFIPHNTNGTGDVVDVANVASIVRRPRTFMWVILGGIVVFFVSFAVIPPPSFPRGVTVTIPLGSSLRDAARILRAHNVVRSSAFLESYVILFDGERSIKAGEYFFPTAVPPFTVASRITEGEYGFMQIALTFPEGSTRQDIARIAGIRENLPFFDTTEFLLLTEGKEGYLFPDTYFVSQNARAGDIVRIMEQNFMRQIKEKESAVASSGRTLADIITMASIIEAEARTSEDRRTVSGILWKRNAIGMPLQVDAVFLVVNGKKTDELTLDDLKFDSPYNTYRHKGLPPGPINNPGMDSIEAAIRPESSPYLYYLSDHEGTMHYAKTFEEHKANKRRYLS